MIESLEKDLFIKDNEISKIKKIMVLLEIDNKKIKKLKQEICYKYAWNIYTKY